LEDGPQYREGDDEQAMITLDYLHNEWEEFEPDDTDDDEFGEDDGPEPVSSTLKYFQSEDGNEAVLAGIGIFEDSRVAEESVEDYTNSNFVGEESVNLGDGGERGVFNETWALVAFSHSNVFIISGAVSQSGLELQPNYGRSYTLGEDLLGNLKEL
jgi:hypothetical protein